MSLPSSQSRKVPEGAYTFTISEVPEKRWHNKDSEKEFVTITFFFRLEDTQGDTHKHRESLVPWSPVYQDILIALGGELDDKGNAHLGDTEEDLVGRSFTAEIFHEPDKDDPRKSWARITNIEPPKSETGEDNFEEDVPPPNGETEDEVPF